jgi:hypothetical protein
VTVQVVFDSEHAPLQPTNTDGRFGVAVRLTEVFSAYFSEQSPGQLIPLTLVVATEPLPNTVTIRS